MVEHIFTTFGSRAAAFNGLIKSTAEDIAKQFDGRELAIIMGRIELIQSQHKGILKEINAELAKGPLAGYIFCNAVVRYPIADSDNAGFQYRYKTYASPFQLKNRLKVYQGYLNRLMQKHDRLQQEKGNRAT